MEKFDPSTYSFDDAKRDFDDLLEKELVQDDGWETFVNTSNSHGDSTKIWRKYDKEVPLTIALL